jgi:hypothetical protein
MIPQPLQVIRTPSMVAILAEGIIDHLRGLYPNLRQTHAISAKRLVRLVRLAAWPALPEQAGRRSWRPRRASGRGQRGPPSRLRGPSGTLPGPGAVPGPRRDDEAGKALWQKSSLGAVAKTDFTTLSSAPPKTIAPCAENNRGLLEKLKSMPIGAPESGPRGPTGFG